MPSLSLVSDLLVLFFSGFDACYCDGNGASNVGLLFRLMHIPVIFAVLN
jgi:hypothetical protein